MIQKLHNEEVDGKPKATLESGLIETHFPRQKMIGPFLSVKKTNPNPLKELEPIPKPGKGVKVQTTHLLEGMKSPSLSWARSSGILLHLNEVITRRQPSL